MCVCVCPQLPTLPPPGKGNPTCCGRCRCQRQRRSGTHRSPPVSWRALGGEGGAAIWGGVAWEWGCHGAGAVPTAAVRLCPPPYHISCPPPPPPGSDLGPWELPLSSRPLSPILEQLQLQLKVRTPGLSLRGHVVPHPGTPGVPPPDTGGGPCPPLSTVAAAGAPSPVGGGRPAEAAAGGRAAAAQAGWGVGLWRGDDPGGSWGSLRGGL